MLSAALYVFAALTVCVFTALLLLRSVPSTNLVNPALEVRQISVLLGHVLIDNNSSSQSNDGRNLVDSVVNHKVSDLGFVGLDINGIDGVGGLLLDNLLQSLGHRLREGIVSNVEVAQQRCGKGLELVKFLRVSDSEENSVSSVRPNCTGGECSTVEKSPARTPEKREIGRSIFKWRW